MEKEEGSRFVTNKLEIRAERTLCFKSISVQNMMFSKEIGEALEKGEVTIGDGHETKDHHGIGRKKHVNERN